MLLICLLQDAAMDVGQRQQSRYLSGSKMKLAHLWYVTASDRPGNSTRSAWTLDLASQSEAYIPDDRTKFGLRGVLQSCSNMVKAVFELAQYERDIDMCIMTDTANLLLQKTRM